MLLLLSACINNHPPVRDGVVFPDTGFFEGDADVDVDTDADADGDADADTDVDPYFDDLDGDGFSEADEDCNDADARIYPSAPDACDGLDNDCDGEIDEGGTGPHRLFVDDDHDGYGTAEEVFVDVICPLEAGASLRNGDCDDADAAVHRGAADDTCNGIDENCDGLTDDGHPDAGWFFYDLDGDGYAGHQAHGCPQPGAETESTDCDETRADVNPGVEEIWFDGVDQDCDFNDDNPPDRDADGFAEHEDCDDLSVSVHPGAAEACGNGVDDDCSGEVDEGCNGDRPADPPLEKGCTSAPRHRAPWVSLQRR